MSRPIFIAIASAALAACFSPTFPQGIPCSAEGECPGDQICASDNRCYDDDPADNDAGFDPDAALSNLVVSRGVLEPAFDPSVRSYSLALGLGAEDLIVTPTTNAIGATITVNETDVVSGADSPPIALNLGENSVSVVVTTDDGSTNTYQVTTNRGAGIAQEAYAKASNTQNIDIFGSAIGISDNTLVVGARGEDSGANEVGGDQQNNDASFSGAAYVFVNEGSGWAQQAYLKASNSETNDRFGIQVAISGDTIAVSATGEDSVATGVDGNQGDNNASGSGAVYVFSRTGTTWSQQAYIKASNTDAGDLFGISISLSGTTLAVGARAEGSSATGINGNQNDNTAGFSGAVYVFTRSGNTWSQQAYIKASNTQASDLFGSSVAVDGDTLVVGAVGEDSSTTGVNGSQQDEGATGSGASYVYVRNGSSWFQQAYLKASNTDADDRFGEVVAVSGDSIAVAAREEASNSTGVDGDQSNNLASGAGAVYLFRRNDVAWSQEAYLKGSNTEAEDGFGGSIALRGSALVVGANGEDSSGQDSEADNAAPAAGAAYLFVRDGEWTQLAYIKASNPNGGDAFGASVGISDTRAVVGAQNEASAATGIDGDQADNSADQAGAVYIFE